MMMIVHTVVNGCRCRFAVAPSGSSATTASVSSPLEATTSIVAPIALAVLWPLLEPLELVRLGGSWSP